MDVGKKNITKSLTSQFNRSIVQLVQYLENKGVKSRYGVKHLNFWANLIAEGEVVGPNKEPDWKCYLKEIDGVLPRKIKSENQSPCTFKVTNTGAQTGIEHVQATLLQNNQLLQASLMTLLSPRFSSPQGSPELQMVQSPSGNTKVNQAICPRMTNFLSSIGLEKYAQKFEDSRN